MICFAFHTALLIYAADTLILIALHRIWNLLYLQVGGGWRESEVVICLLLFQEDELQIQGLHLTFPC